jgi:hypothetical protein
MGNTIFTRTGLPRCLPGSHFVSANTRMASSSQPEPMPFKIFKSEGSPFLLIMLRQMKVVHCVVR